MTPVQPPLGILMLDTRFPRVPGDVGNPATWPFPVRYAVVRDASPERVVRGDARGLLDAFAAAGRALAADGAVGIITTCGFLALHQRELARALPVPFVSSSLMQVPLVARTLSPGKRPGVITIDAASLTARHLEAVGVDPVTPVVGVAPDGAFARAILGDRPSLDTAAAEREILAAGEQLVAEHPDVAAIVLECTNMPPYANALRARLALPVYDMVSFGRWLYAGLVPVPGAKRATGRGRRPSAARRTRP
jgi:hypothetical protein